MIAAAAFVLAVTLANVTGWEIVVRYSPQDWDLIGRSEDRIAGPFARKDLCEARRLITELPRPFAKLRCDAVVDWRVR